MDALHVGKRQRSNVFPKAPRSLFPTPARDSAETPLITQAILDAATASMRDEMAGMLAELKKTVADNSEATAQLQDASQAVSNNFTNVQKQFGAAADSVDVATGAVCVEMRRLHSAPTTFALIFYFRLDQTFYREQISTSTTTETQALAYYQRHLFF